MPIEEQQLHLHLMRYRYPISYIHVPEKKKLHASTADTLSRAPVADSADAQLQDIRKE